jgi:hypothetical protein
LKGNLLKLQDIKKNNEWCDKNRVLLLACFQILVDFIEKEKPQRIVDYKSDKEHKRQWKELQTLYHYWKKERPRLQKDAERALRKSGINMVPDPSKKSGTRSVAIKFTFKDKRVFNLGSRLEDKLDRLDDEMLQRLINMRHHLWC